MSYVLQCHVTFESEADAQDAYDQIRARATNASVARIGEPGERTSHSLLLDESDDSIIERWHVDRFGIVRDGAMIPDDEVPEWVQPSGSQDAYPLDDVFGSPARVQHEGTVYENRTDANTTTPGENGDQYWEPV